MIWRLAEGQNKREVVCGNLREVDRVVTSGCSQLREL